MHFAPNFRFHPTLIVWLLKSLIADGVFRCCWGLTYLSSSTSTSTSTSASASASVSEFVSGSGWKLQLGDAFPWARGEPTVRCALLVVSPDRADPSGVAPNFRFHPTLLVRILRSITVSSV